MQPKKTKKIELAWVEVQKFKLLIINSLVIYAAF